LVVVRIIIDELIILQTIHSHPLLIVKIVIVKVVIRIVVEVIVKYGIKIMAIDIRVRRIGEVRTKIIAEAIIIIIICIIIDLVCVIIHRLPRKISHIHRLLIIVVLHIIIVHFVVTSS
jgi:hypothetical protein